jgi:hypothetical protein
MHSRGNRGECGRVPFREDFPGLCRRLLGHQNVKCCDAAIRCGSLIYDFVNLLMYGINYRSVVTGDTSSPYSSTYDSFAALRTIPFSYHGRVADFSRQAESVELWT